MIVIVRSRHRVRSRAGFVVPADGFGGTPIPDSTPATLRKRALPAACMTDEWLSTCGEWILDGIRNRAAAMREARVLDERQN